MLVTLQRFSLLSRCLILWPATIALIAAIFAPSSLSAAVASQEGALAHLVIGTMVALVLVGWLDVIVNDLMPHNWHMQWARSRRHIGYSFLAGLYLVRAFASLDAAVADAWIVTLHHVVWALLCGWYTFAAALRPDHAL